MTPADLYLDLLKRTLTGMVYEDPPIQIRGVPSGGYQRQARELADDWPQHAPCMIGTVRLENVQQCVQRVLADGVPGDLAEAGAWRGGTTIFMRALLELHGVTDRDVWVIDSFEGLPPAAADAGGWDAAMRGPLAVPLEEVRHNFELYGFLDEHVRFLKGWFCDTLPTAPIGPLAVLRLDGDLYESQRDVLVNLYPKLSPGSPAAPGPSTNAARSTVSPIRCWSQVRDPAWPTGASHDGHGSFADGGGHGCLAPSLLPEGNPGRLVAGARDR